MYDFQIGHIRYIKGGKYPSCHTVFIEDEIRAVIDPACDKNVLKRIHQEKPIDVVLNSHCHEDHFRYNYLFPEAQLWVSEIEARFYRKIDCLMDAWLEPGERGTAHEEESRRWLVEDMHYEEREPQRMLKDGDIIDFGNTRVQVLHMPGHNSGHLCFHFLNERAIYTADLDLVPAGPYYGDNNSDLEDMIASLKRLEKIDVDYYLAAHGKVGLYEGDPKYVRDYLNVIQKREEKLIDFLEEGPKTIQEITDRGIIYNNRGSIDSWDLSISEKRMMEKHLKQLQRKGSLFSEDGRYFLSV
jgi:glyoxylase-like metal-dependent hydrolase (beta-lactamase superfamily II)